MLSNLRPEDVLIVKTHFETRKPAITWRGKEIDTIGGLLDTVFSIYKRQNTTERDNFMGQYSLWLDHPKYLRPNINTVIGFIGGNELNHEIRNWWWS